MAGGRIDPETGEELKPGQMTRAEFRAWWPTVVSGWQEALCGREPPGPDGWVWVRWIGWVRQRGKKGKR